MVRCSWRAVARSQEKTRWPILSAFSVTEQQVLPTERRDGLCMTTRTVTAQPFTGRQATMHLLNCIDRKEYTHGHPIWQRPQHEKKQPR